jgi:2-polyprenyl-3-methyl-5-hydroxy-6-metoxy-1,4-benzoquinol methylase
VFRRWEGALLRRLDKKFFQWSSARASVAQQVDRYSDEFESEIAYYVSGNRDERNEKVQTELYLKLTYARQFFEFCRRYIDLQGKKFLEVGCGTGYVSVAAAQFGAKVAATDVVQRAVHLTQARWQEHGLDANLFVSDIRDRTPGHLIANFDFVFCYQVIEHIERQDHFKSLANLFSMVAPGGYLFIDTENNMCPFDRHDTRTWLIRLLSKSAYDPLLDSMGRGINFYEPSAKRKVITRDYISYDELLGAALVSGFDVVSPFMPHGDKRQFLFILTGSHWLHDEVLKDVDVERFAPIAILLRKRPS